MHDWELIKNIWKRTANNWAKCYTIDTLVQNRHVLGEDGSSGLCSFIIKQFNNGLNHDMVFMLGRINSIPGHTNTANYAWPLTKAGAKNRVKFCKREARINWEKIGKSWRQMSEDWENCKIVDGTALCRSSIECLGLCSQIGCLNINALDKEIMLSTFESLPANRKYPAYKWPLTKAGAKRRKEFCDEQAKRLGC